MQTSTASRFLVLACSKGNNSRVGRHDEYTSRLHTLLLLSDEFIWPILKLILLQPVSPSPLTLLPLLPLLLYLFIYLWPLLKCPDIRCNPSSQFLILDSNLWSQWKKMVGCLHLGSEHFFGPTWWDAASNRKWIYHKLHEKIS